MKSNYSFKFPVIDTVLSVAVIGSVAALVLAVVFSPDVLSVLA